MFIDQKAYKPKNTTLSGIYLHIPFCKQACHYCNFHFSTSLRHKTPMVEALKQEITLRKTYLPTTQIDTIYFGGGTPSLLSADEIQDIIDHIAQCFTIAKDAEITLEANPDDLTPNKLLRLRKTTAVNRLSIGIQSFDEQDLVFMNRAHNAQEAQKCIETAQAIGFHNISIDLIYGSPTTSHATWQQNLARTFAFGIPHISAYCLTVEPNTALHHFVQQNKAPDVDDDHAAQQFETLIAAMEKAGYWHYETSNFCLPHQISRHNTSYWQGKPYLGIGPAAHSFNGTSRQWNIAHNPKYLKAIANGNVPSETETLSTTQRFNEYLLTTLRTMWGADLDFISQTFGVSYTQHLQDNAQKFMNLGQMSITNNKVLLNPKGKFIADGIIADLFVE